MKLKNKLLIAFSFGILLGAWNLQAAEPAAYDPCVLKVQPGASIQAAVNAAETFAAGGVVCRIWLGAGTFHETVSIGDSQPHLKQLSLSGVSPAHTVLEGAILVRFTQENGMPADGVRTSVQNLTLEGSGTAAYGIKTFGGELSVSNVHVKNYKWGGIYGEANARVEVTRSIVEHANNGVLVNGTIARLFLLNNTLAFNQTAGAALIFAGVGYPKGTLINNIFYENGTAVHGSTASEIQLGYNDFYGNHTNYLMPVIGDPNLEEVDPQFVDADAGNFGLLGTSPLRDAGDPAAPYDADGTRADIGARALAAGRPALIAAAIEKIHGTEMYRQVLPLDGSPAVEARQGGLGTVRLTFGSPVGAADIRFMLSNGRILSQEAHGEEIALQITDVPDNVCVSIGVDGIENDVNYFLIGMLEGDADQNGEVNLQDLLYARNAMFKPHRTALQNEFTADVNLSGRVDVRDLIDIHRKRGRALGCL